MNVFERMELRRALLRSQIVPTWKTFQSAIKELVSSYNLIEEGKRWPAKVESSGDTSIVISSERGMAHDSFHSVSLVVAIGLDEGHYRINATGEDWFLLKGSKRNVEKFIEVDFILDGDPEQIATWLVHNKKKFSVQQAAEAILERALLHQAGVPFPDIQIVSPSTISPI